MTIKVSTKTDFKDLNNMIPNIKKRFGKDLKGQITEIIKAKILSGFSPVAGFNKFKAYSPAYAKRKGVSRTSVNMKDTGSMLASLRAKQMSNGDLEVFFGSSIAKFHDTPGLARVLRKLLPSQPGQQFKKDILNRINKVLQGAISKET